MGVPVTSAAAHADHEASGDAATNRVQVWNLVVANPGCTAVELSKLTTVDRIEISRRLPELAEAGVIRRGEVRKCKVNNRLMTTWWPKRKDTLF